MESASGGDDKRLRRWATEHGPAIRAFVFARSKDWHLADDLLQETLCRAWENRDRYHDSGTERGFLLRIADRLLMDHFRRTKRRRTESLPEEIVNDQRRTTQSSQSNTLSTISEQETTVAVHAALAQLTDTQRRVLLLRFFGQLGFAEIASTIGIPLGTALSHCRRGLESIRNLLKSGGEEVDE